MRKLLASIKDNEKNPDTHWNNTIHNEKTPIMKKNNRISNDQTGKMIPENFFTGGSVVGWKDD